MHYDSAENLWREKTIIIIEIKKPRKMHSACIIYVLMTLFTMMTAEADRYIHRLGRQAIVGATDHLKVVENLSLVSYPQA